MKKRDLWRKVSSSLLAFFLAMMIFGVYLIIGLHMGVFGTTTIDQAIKDSDYFEESYHELESKFNWYLEDMELAREVVKETITLQQFYIDARTQMQEIMNHQTSSATLGETFGIRQQDLIDKLNVAYAKQYIVLTDDQITKIDHVSEVILQLYQEQMNFKLVKDIVTYKNQFTNDSTYIVIGLVIVSCIILGLLLKMYHHKHKALRYVAYSILSASGMMVLLVLMLSKRLDYATIPKDHAYYQRFIEILTRESEIALLFPAGFGMILCCLLLVLIKEIKKRAAGEK